MAEEKSTIEPTTLEALDRIETNNVRPACFRSTFHEILFVLTCTMAIAMSAWLAGAVTVISSFVGADLNMTTAQITWITSATSLASGAFLLFFGKLADLFGRKSMFVGSLFLYAVFALAAGFSKDPLTLDVLSGLLGLVSASSVPPAVGLLGIIYEKPSKRKNAAFACFSAGNPLGFVFGTVFSGIATQIFNWRASYYLIAIIFLLFSVIGWFTIPRDPSAKETFTWQTVKRFDIVGTILTIAGIGMFSAALSLGDTAPQGWRTPYVLALLIIGILLLIGFVFWEMFYPYPLMPMTIWKDRNFSLCMAILALGFFAFTPGSFFVALYFQQVWHMSALEVAVHLLPMVIMGILTNIFAGVFMHRISNKLLMFAGTMGYTIAYLLSALNRQDSSYWSFFFPSFVLVVIGADLEFTVANLYVMQSLPKESQSVAGGIFQTIVRLCMTVGFGITTALFNATQQNPSLPSYWATETQPYTVTFWWSFTCAALSVCLVPFLTIGTQGGKEKRPAVSPDSALSLSDEKLAVDDVKP